MSASQFSILMSEERARAIERQQLNNQPKDTTMTEEKKPSKAEVRAMKSFLKKDKRNEKQRKADAESSLRELLNDARTALDYLESNDYEEAECQFQHVSDDADFVHSELETLVRYMAIPPRYRNSLTVPR